MSGDEAYEKFSPLWHDLSTADCFPHKRPLLAHYTSIETLEQIMSSNQLWFSNPLYMNDLEELRFGVNEGLLAFKNNEAIRKACNSQFRYEILLTAFNNFYNIYNNEHAFDTYVFCSSKHDTNNPDGLLSMWRGYGSNGSGAAIVFDTSKIDYQEDSPLFISHVTYASQQIRREKIIQKLNGFAELLSRENIPDEYLPAAASAIFNRLKIAAILTKHNGFIEEQEWRAVYLREFDREKKLDHMLHYSTGKRGIEPKLKFEVSTIPGITGSNLYLEEIVHQIILGPTSSSPLAVMSIKRMLEKVGKKILADRVYASSTPFRPN